MVPKSNEAHIASITLWVNPETRIEPASVSFTIRIGQLTLFFEENEAGLAKMREISDTLQRLIAANGVLPAEPNEPLAVTACAHPDIKWVDYGTCNQTGYKDCGWICQDCGEQVDAPTGQEISLSGETAQ